MDVSILKKLRFSPDLDSTLVNAPESFQRSFSELAGTKSIGRTISDGKDWKLIFVFNKKDIDKVGVEAVESSNESTIIWFAYPKKTSKIKTDISRDKGWEAIHNKGWSGVAMVSIDETWSAFRVKPQTGSTPTGTTSDASVKAATGKDWAGWFKELNKQGAKLLTHKEIAVKLSKEFNLDGWWSQMVTNSYEQHIGRRQKHQMADGYQISVSKTLPVPLPNIFQAFNDVRERSKWLKDPGFEISTVRKDKSLRALWVDGKTRISVDFVTTNSGKTQVTVQHFKLKTAKECDKMKTYWKKSLESLLALKSDSN